MKRTSVVLPMEVRIPQWLWDQFLESARRRRRKPVAMLQEAVLDHVRRVTGLDLIEDSCRAARRTGLREEDAVEIVKEFRRERALEEKNGRAETTTARRS